MNKSTFVNMALSTLLLGCAIEPQSTLSGELDEDGIFATETIDGDTIVTIAQEGEFQGIQITSINPVSGIGSLEWNEAQSFCSRLNFAGHHDYKVVDEATAEFLIRHDIELHPGYSGDVWYQTTFLDRLNYIKQVQASITGQSQSHTLFALSLLGFDSLEDLNRQYTQTLERVEDGRGGETYGGGMYRVTEGDLTPRFDLLRHLWNGPFNVLCMREPSEDRLSQGELTTLDASSYGLGEVRYVKVLKDHSVKFPVPTSRDLSPTQLESLQRLWSAEETFRSDRLSRHAESLGCDLNAVDDEVDLDARCFTSISYPEYEAVRPIHIAPRIRTGGMRLPRQTPPVMRCSGGSDWCFYNRPLEVTADLIQPYGFKLSKQDMTTEFRDFIESEGIDQIRTIESWGGKNILVTSAFSDVRYNAVVTDQVFFIE